MKKIAIIACSHNKDSKSTLLARKAADQLDGSRLFLLKELDLPFCDGDSVYSLPQIEKLTEELQQFDAFIFSTPIYNFSVNAAAKNFIELFGDCLKGKTVGLMAAAGGVRGYMGLCAFSNSLALDFRCRVLPKSLFASADDWNQENKLSPELEGRLDELLKEIKI